jgi:hypothetical protein
MPFKEEIRVAVDSYARGDLPGDVDHHVEFFEFLDDDPGLQRRVGEEFFTARYIYKILEGLRIDEEWARRAQIQLQVQQYASIYEACLHHVVFVTCGSEPTVRELLKMAGLRPYQVSKELQDGLSAVSAPNGAAVVAAVESEFKRAETTVRFEEKADVAVELGIIDPPLAAELKEFYTARNMIHIHAELRKEPNWELDLAKNAYRRLELLRRQIVQWQGARRAAVP